MTGSSRGIGAHLAVALAERGANVAIAYTSSSSTEAAENVAKQIRALGRKSCVIQCDLDDADSGNRIVKAAREGLQVETIEILVNNAALPEPHGPTRVEDFDPGSFDRIMHVNIRAPILLVKAILPYFGPAANRIINISSIGGHINSPNYQLYSCSKAGIDSLTRSWAKELAKKYHCTVNGVLVGPTVTDTAPDSEARAAAKSATTAEHRLGTPDDVGEIVAWLVAEGSRWVNGDMIGANGGIVIQT